MNKKILLILGLITAGIIIAGGYFFLTKNQTDSPQYSPVSSQPTIETQKSQNSQPAPVDYIYNYLLLGQVDPGHDGGSLTDSLMVISLNTQKKSVAMISIPRDLWVSLPQNKKISEAYLVGGFPLVKQIIGEVTSLPIRNIILIDFNGFTQAIDRLGKIEVKVPQTFDDYFYPVRGKELENCDMTPEKLVAINATMSGFQLEKQYTCRYEHLHFDVGANNMDGATALKFVRSRHSDQGGNDFSRAGRQQAVIIGIKNKLLSLNALGKVPYFFDKLINLVKTDLDKNSAVAIADLIVNPNEYKITNIVLSLDNVLKESKSSGGAYILLPKAGQNNYSEIQAYIKNQINQEVP